MKIYYTAKLLLVLFLLSASAAVNGQGNSKTPSGGGGGFTIGFGSMNVSALHNFVPSSVKQFTSEHLLIGGTGHAYRGNFIIGGSGCGITGNKIITDSFTYSLGGGMGTFDIGYLILNRKRLKVYPMLGIGGGGFGIQTIKNKDISIDEVKNNPMRELSINKSSFLFDISLNLDFIPQADIRKDDNSYGGFLTGLRIGYLYSIPSSDWGYAGGNIVNGPDFGFNMLYIKLVLGGAGFDQ